MGEKRKLEEVLDLLRLVRTRRGSAQPCVRDGLDAIAQDHGIVRPEQVYPRVFCARRSLQRHFRLQMRSWLGHRGQDLTVEHYVKLVGIERALGDMIDDPHQSLDILANRRGYDRVSSMCRAWRRSVGITPGLVARWLRKHGGRATDAPSMDEIARELDELAAKRAGERERERERESSGNACR